MKYFKGDGEDCYFCRNPLSGKGPYTCQYILDIEKMPNHYDNDKIFEVLKNATPEWNNCIITLTVERKDGGFPDHIPTLKQEVRNWLDENIDDSTDPDRSKSPKGWMIYDPHATSESLSVAIFFLRESDALAFKLRWE